MARAGPTSRSPSASTAAHAVALYASDADLRRRILPFVHDGLAAGETVVAVVSEHAAAQLRNALGDDHRDDHGGVQWGVPGVSYRSLGPMVDGLRRYLAGQREAGQQVRLLAENDTSSSAARAAAYLRFEAASNEVLGGYGFPWACLYDRRRYPPEVLEQVTQVHPHLLDHDGHVTDSTTFLPPDTYLAAHPGPLSAVPPRVALDVWLADAGQLAAARHAAVETASSLRLATGDSDDFELAAGEVLSNALRHGERPVRVRLWATAEHVVFRVDDQGPGDDIATKGFRPPDLAQSHFGGMGVWIIRQLADAVHVNTGPAGTAVEVQFPRTQPDPATDHG